MIKKNLIIIVIASFSPVYNDTVKHYWKPFIDYVNKNVPQVQIFLLYGKSYCSSLGIHPDNLLTFEINETYKPGILKKTVKAFEFIQKNFEFKKVFRTNISSFLVINNMMKVCNELPDNDELLYAGVNLKKKFVSGAGFWLNPTSVKYIVNHQNDLNYKVIDDVAIGKLLMDKYKIRKCKRYDMKTNQIKNSNDMKKKLYEILQNNHYHVRIKTKYHRIKKDIPIFKYLTRVFYLEDKNINKF